jgi:ATP-dependent DNA helicase RecQ
VFYKAEEDVISEVLLTKPSLNAVKDQLSRFLESYMSNVGLNFISGIIRLVLNDFDDPDGRNRLESSLTIIKDYSVSDRIIIIESLLKVIGPQLTIDNKSDLTMTIHKILNDDKILWMLNKHLDDDYSLSILLEHKLNKIKDLTSLMRDNTCQLL